MLRNSPFFQLYLARLREFWRQPARIFWVYGFPLLLATVLGYAFQSRPPAPILVDLVDGPDAARIADAIRARDDGLAPTSGSPAEPASPVLAPVRVVLRPRAAADDRMDKGKSVLEVIPEGPSSWTFRYDPTRPESVSARQVVDDILERAAGRKDVGRARDIPVTEPGARYIDRLIPGLIGLNAMGGGLWGIGFFLVNLRIGKLLKCYLATPMPRHDFLGALLASRLTFLVPDVSALLLLGVLAFRMPVRGNLLVFFLVDVAGALAFAGIGLLVASRATTTETVSGLMNLVMLPMYLLSGVFFSTENFGEAAQPFLQALPLTQLVTALRLVLLDGAGLLDLGVLKALAILGAWAAGTFYVALRIFRWN
ncbi:ABC-2 type transporter [Aquisphaera giovannonii]|uniref:Transport permease protein n=1 Tax=Aquisphaera giovannonii TaxID=406548 RepID=A0A5B9WAE3_9BACT|nr:ABC transporter permease [Aquisphaera giovannonii]QEH37506.1 ABC-2 type transporter [Aquisphaera giovannonii]